MTCSMAALSVVSSWISYLARIFKMGLSLSHHWVFGIRCLQATTLINEKSKVKTTRNILEIIKETYCKAALGDLKPLQGAENFTVKQLCVVIIFVNNCMPVKIRTWTIWTYYCSALFICSNPGSKCKLVFFLIKLYNSRHYFAYT